MSTDGRWVGGKWIPDGMEDVMLQFLAKYGKPTVSHQPKRQARPVFKSVNLSGVSPAEYRRRHLGAKP